MEYWQVSFIKHISFISRYWNIFRASIYNFGLLADKEFWIYSNISKQKMCIAISPWFCTVISSRPQILKILKIAKNWHLRCARWWNDFEIEHIRNILWTHSEHTLNTLLTYSEHILNTLWTHSEHFLMTLWAHSEHTLKICPIFDKISKTLVTHPLSNMNPRDASASKKDLTKIW